MQEQEEWLLKDDVAKILGVGIAQVEARARQGVLRKQMMPKLPGERQARVAYLREDVIALKDGTPRMQGIVRASPAPFMAPKPWREFAGKPWLTLDEAAAFSGLTEDWLLKEAESGEGGITARDMGEHARDGRWRFFRGDLEQPE